MQLTINRPSREQIAKLGFGVLLVLMYDIVGFFIAVLVYFSPFRQALVTTLPQRGPEPETPTALIHRPALLPAHEALQLIDKAMTCQRNCGICTAPGTTNGLCNYIVTARTLIPHGLTDVFGALMEEMVNLAMLIKVLQYRLEKTERVVHPMNRVVWAVLVGVVGLLFFAIQTYIGVYLL